MPLTKRRELWIPLQLGQSVTVANGSNFNIRPWQNVNAAASAIPSWVRYIEVRGLSMAFTTNPVADSFELWFQPYPITLNAGFGTPEGTSTAGSVTATQNFNNGSNNYRYYFTSNYVFSFSSASINDAAISSFYTLLVALRNTSGGSLTTTSDNWFNGMLLCY